MGSNKFMLGLALSLLALVLSATVSRAGDLDDGISEYTDEAISADDNMGSKDTNVNFIVVDAIGKAKMMQPKDKNGGKDGNPKPNKYDGNGDYNENSVVVEPGAKIDKVYNIVIER